MNLFNPFADQVRAFSKVYLVAAYRRAKAGVDEAEAKTLLAEIERRGLNFLNHKNSIVV